MTKLTQPINSAVAEMAADKLLNFQLMIRDIPGILRLTFGEPGFDVDDKIKQATIDAVNGNRSHYAESQGETDLRQEVVAYFNNFATKHIFGEINTALNAENKSTDEISNLSAVFTDAVTDDSDTDDVNEAAPAKIVFTYTATDMRYNGEIEEGGADKTNHRLVNGNITLTVTGTVSDGTTFTATDFTFAGTDLRLTDAQTGKDYETLLESLQGSVRRKEIHERKIERKHKRECDFQPAEDNRHYHAEAISEVLKIKRYYEHDISSEQEDKEEKEQ